VTISVEQGFIIVEGTIASVEDWCKALLIDNAAIAALITQGVFQRSRSANGQSQLRLNMVGLIATQNKAFFCLPKIYAGNDIDLSTSIRSVLSAVQTYHRYIQRGPEASLSGEADIFLGGGSLLDHFLRLWEWTRDFGLHQDEQPIRNDGYQSINWRSTIWNSLPVHQSGSVIYPEPIGEKIAQSLSDLGVLQAYALKKIQYALGNVSDIFSEKNDNIWTSCSEAINNTALYLNDIFSINGIIYLYEGICTRDNDVELVDILKNYFEEFYKKSSSPILYGVSSFHVVWENMCVSIFNNFGDSRVHSDIATQPSYNLYGKILELEAQRPDILRSLDQGIIIGDAKWYKADSNDLPKTPDAIKQFSYQNSILKEYSIIGNFLFLPTLSNVEWIYLGKLTMKFGKDDDPRFPDVHLIGLGWKNMVSLYAKSACFPPEFCDWLVTIGSNKINI